MSIEAERRLAELLYPESKLSFSENGNYWYRNHKDDPWSNFLGYVPKWTRDNDAAFSLMVEFEICPTFYPNDGISTFCEGQIQGLFHFYYEHADVEATLRFAIVQHVIAFLENKK